MNRGVYWIALCAGCAAASLGASATRGIAQPDLFFNTQITAFDLGGTALVPLGENGASVLADIVVTKAPDHNSSRSNKTGSAIQPPDPNDADDVDPDALHGQPLTLSSTIDVCFSLSFSPNDPRTTFAILLGANPSSATEGPAQLDLDAPGSFTFDRESPSFGMLDVGAPMRALSWRGHVTVLKLNFGGGGGDVDLAMDGIALRAIEGSDKYFPLPTGELEHRFGVELDLTGTYAGQPFAVTGLTGTLVERGTLFNQIVPEPAAAMLAAVGTTVAVGWNRSRRRRSSR